MRDRWPWQLCGPTTLVTDEQTAMALLANQLKMDAQALVSLNRAFKP